MRGVTVRRVKRTRNSLAKWHRWGDTHTWNSDGEATDKAPRRPGVGWRARSPPSQRRSSTASLASRPRGTQRGPKPRRTDAPAARAAAWSRRPTLPPRSSRRPYRTTPRTSRSDGSRVVEAYPTRRLRALFHRDEANSSDFQLCSNLMFDKISV